MTLRVLQVCPFGIPEEPSSGGQIRIAAIEAAYRSAGCAVDRCCVVTRERDARNPLDIVMPWWDRARRYHLGKPGNLGQIRQHWAAEKGSLLQRQLAMKLTERYDVVHVEHSWDVELICRLRGHPSLKQGRLVYSSHNVEQELFESVVRERGEWTAAAQRLAKEIGSIEHAAAARADLIWTVSQHDANVLGRTGTPCVVAPNGCRTLPDDASDPAFTHLPGPYAVFVGANFAPNVHGFLGMLGNDLGFLPAGASVHTIGTCAEALKSHTPHQPWIKARRLVHHGRVPQEKLDAALRLATVVILPITSGGGTNLKTAEALSTGHSILGTHQAFRGFEDWMHTPGVQVEDSPEAFRLKLAKLLTGTNTPKHTQVADRSDLTWSHVLQPALEKTLALLHSSLP